MSCNWRQVTSKFKMLRIQGNARVGPEKESFENESKRPNWQNGILVVICLKAKIVITFQCLNTDSHFNWCLWSIVIIMMELQWNHRSTKNNTTVPVVYTKMNNSYTHSKPDIHGSPFSAITTSSEQAMREMWNALLLSKALKNMRQK